MREPRGVFVTLNEHGRLRGCIGSIAPVRPLFEDIIENAGNAALRDHRFSPVQVGELPNLEIEVSVLTVPAEVPGTGAILIGRDGIIIEKAGRRAVFLPQVAIEQGWNLEQTLRALCMKAGLPEDAWTGGMRFFTFQAQVFAEPRT